MHDLSTLGRKRLVALLLSMFSTAELLGFLDSTYSPSLRTRLPDSVEPIEMVTRTVALLERDGLISNDLFHALRLARPNRVREIMSVGQLCGPNSPAEFEGRAEKAFGPQPSLVTQTILAVAICEAIILAVIALNQCGQLPLSPGANDIAGDSDAVFPTFACRRSMYILEIIVNSNEPNAQQIIAEARRHIDQCKTLMARIADAPVEANQ